MSVAADKQDKEKRPPAPRNKFGMFLANHGITYSEFARQFSMTRSFAQDLGTGGANPTIKLAKKIEDWCREIDPADIVVISDWAVES